MRILVAEDEGELNRLIRCTLEDEGYAVDAVLDGQSALDYLQAGEYDAVILDIMMPKLDGLTVLRRYRSGGGRSPVIFLTARDAIDDRVEGLDSGDKGEQKSNTLTVADLTLDLSSHRVTRGGKEIELSSKEFAILEYMMLNEGTILSRESFRNHVWSWDYEGESNVVDVYIRFLRKKIDDGFEKKLIQTVRGSGYMIKG